MAPLRTTNSGGVGPSLGLTPGPRPAGPLRGDAFRDVEPVAVRELNIEEDQVRKSLLGALQGRPAVSRLAHDLVPLGFEQDARARAKPGVVVDYENSW